MRIGDRATRLAARAVVTAVAVAGTWVGVPATAHAEDPVVRDALVVDHVNDSSYYGPDTSQALYDSLRGNAPVVSATATPGGVRLTRPTDARTGPGIEVIPDSTGRLTVGSFRPTSYLPGGTRTQPVVRVVSPPSFCTTLSSAPGRLEVEDVEYAADGVLTSLSASYQMSCSGGGTLSGIVRVASTRGYTSGASAAVKLGRVTAGSRSARLMTLRNTGTEPLPLGDATPATVAADQPRLEVVAGTDTCSGQTLAAGAQCTLTVEYVDDGIPGGGYPAWLAIPASTLYTGLLRVGVSVAEVVYPPLAPTNVVADAGYDGVRLRWSTDSTSPPPEKWRVRRVDGAEPVVVAEVSSPAFVDTTLAKAERATYTVAAVNLAGEVAGQPVAVARPDLPDLPTPTGRSAVVVEGLMAVTVVDTMAGGTVTSRAPVSNAYATTLIAGNSSLDLPRYPGPGTYPLAADTTYPLNLSTVPSGCSTPTGTVDVREAWVRADGTVDRLHADVHATCGTAPLELQLRVGSDASYRAVQVSPVSSATRLLEAVVGESSTPLQVRVQNVGSVTTSVGAPHLSGTGAGEFVTDSDCPASLDPQASCMVDVVFRPHATGNVDNVPVVVPVGTPVGSQELVVSGLASGAPGSWRPDVSGLLDRALVHWDVGGDGLSPLTGIAVERATGDGAFVAMAQLPADTFSWVDTTVVPGTTYRYRLVATNQYGSTPSNDADIATLVAPDEELVVASTQDSSPTGDLWSAPVATGRPYALGTGQDTDLPVVSPDGRSLTYVVYDETGDAGLWVRSLVGSPSPRVLVDSSTADELDPTWSPDGSKVCYSRLTTTTVAVWCVGTGTGAVPAAFPGAGLTVEPTFLPDTSRLLVTDVTVGGVLSLDSTGKRTPVTGTELGSWPAVSPLGDRLAFVTTDDSGYDHVWTVPTAGGVRQEVARASDVYTIYDRPVWSPGGDALVVPTYQPYSGQNVLLWRPNAPLAERLTTINPAHTNDISAVAWRRLDTAAPSISFPAAPVKTSGSARIPVRVTDDTVPVGGITVACSVDGKAVPRCASGYAGTLAAGTHTLTVTATDPHGHTSTASYRWIVDTAAPTVSVTALPALVLTGTFAVRYAATDASGVASYDVRYRSASSSASSFSAWSQPTVWTKVTATSQVVTPKAGYEYCFSARARDKVGNTSAWSTDRCTARPLDDRSLSTTTSGWTRAASSTAYAETLTRTTTVGAKLTRSAGAFRRVAVVATTCSTCGSVEVYVGSTRIGTVSLWSSTTKTKQTKSLPVLTSARSGTVTLRATTKGRSVQVDGLLLRKT